MKKALLLLSALFLFGCGLGGGTTTSSNTGTNPGGTNPLGGNNAAAPVASFTLNLVDSGSKTTGKTVTVADSRFPVANHVRVIVRQFGAKPKEVDTVTVYDADEDSYTVLPARDYPGHGLSEVQLDPATFQPILSNNGSPVPITDQGVSGSTTSLSAATYHSVPDGEIYKKIIDIDNPTAQVIVNVPIGNKYTFDVLTSKLVGSAHEMLKFGATAATVDITSAGGSADITMKGFNELVTISPLALTKIDAAAPDAITSEEKYSLTVTTIGPIADSYKIKQQMGGLTFAAATYKYGNLGSPLLLTAPTSTGSENSLYFEGLFTITPNMLNSGESPLNWTRIYPNENYGETVYVTLLPVIGTSVPGQ